MKRIILISIICLVYSNAVLATSSSSGADFLKIGNGARNAAMGEATSALVDDVEALNVNVAGLAHMKKMMVFYEHTELYRRIRYESISFAMPISLFTKRIEAVAGVNFNFLYSSKIEGLDYEGKSTGSSGFANYKLVFGYAMKLFKNRIVRLDGGANISMIGKPSSSLSKVSPSIDLAVNTAIYFSEGSKIRQNIGEGVKVSFMVQNIYFANSGKNNNLPICIKFGVGMGVFNKNIHKINVGMDLVKYISSSIKYNIGMEYWIRDLVALRMGGKIGIGQLGYFSGGIGFKYDINGRMIFIDYSIQPYKDIGVKHHISAKLDFGISRKVEDRIELDYYSGVNYLINKKYSKATKMFEKVLKADPEHSGAKEKIEEINKILESEAKIKSKDADDNQKKDEKVKKEKKSKKDKKSEAGKEPKDKK